MNTQVDQLQKLVVYTCTAGVDYSRMSARLKSFGPNEPPLYVTIRSILKKYPDGQIFKVIILFYLSNDTCKRLSDRVVFHDHACNMLNY